MHDRMGAKQVEQGLLVSSNERSPGGVGGVAGRGLGFWTETVDPVSQTGISGGLNSDAVLRLWDKRQECRRSLCA